MRPRQVDPDRVPTDFANYTITARDARLVGHQALDLLCALCRDPIWASTRGEPSLSGARLLDLIRRHEQEGHLDPVSIYPDDLEAIRIELNVNDRIFTTNVTVPEAWRGWSDEERAAWARAQCSQSLWDQTSISWCDERTAAGHMSANPDDWPTWYDWKTGQVTRL